MLSPAAPGSANLPVPPDQRRALAPAQGEGDYGYGPASSGRELSLMLLWRVAVEWRWLILAAIGVGIAGGVLATLLTPRKYRSVASLELNPPQVEVLDNQSTKGGRQQAASDYAFVGTQLGLLGSRALAERVAQNLNLAGDPKVVGKGTDRNINTQIAAGFVQGGTQVQLQPQSMIVRVSFVARDPVIAAKVVNGVTDAYISTNLERRYQSSSYARDFLQRQIASTRRDLEASERKLTAYAQAQRLINTGSADGKNSGGDTNSLTGSSLVALNAALASTEARRIAAEQRYRTAAAGGATTETSANAAGLRTQIAALQAEYQQKLATFRPDYPEMVALKARIDALRASVVTETRTASSDRLGSLRQDFEAAAQEESRLRAQVASLSSSVLDQRGRLIQYNILQRDVDTNRSLYDALLQRYKEIGVAGGVGTAVASVIDRGQVPGGAFSPNLYLNLMIGIGLGLVTGMLAAIALEFVNDTIKTPDDVRGKLRLAFLGGIPQTKTAKPTEELLDLQSPISEAYLSTASAMQFVTEGGTPRTLLITSTRPAEGKSTSALALAQNFVRLGKNVLMIDADMRRPAFVTGRDDIGLSHLLTNTGSTLGEHVLRTEIDNFWIMPSGVIPPSPPELIASSRFAAMLAEAEAAFDVVVIDGPPVIGLADSPLISAVAQATLMVVESGRTRTRPAIEAQNRLRTAGAHMIGAILTRYQPQTSYGYGYGYGYGQKKDQYRYVADDNNRKRRILLSVRDDE